MTAYRLIISCPDCPWQAGAGTAPYTWIVEHGVSPADAARRAQTILDRHIAEHHPDALPVIRYP